jgi:hypothetical protein
MIQCYGIRWSLLYRIVERDSRGARTDFRRMASSIASYSISLWSIIRGGRLELEQAPGTIVLKETETKWPASHKVWKGRHTGSI